MRQFLSFWLLGLLLSVAAQSYAQQVQIGSGETFGNENLLLAETKQINQFFRRFNGEEDYDGKRFYPRDRQYQDPNLRKEYLDILFDQSSRGISPSHKTAFVNDLLNSRNPVILDFHGGDWIAEVQTKFRFQGQMRDATLFLSLEQDTIGSKWVLSHVYFEPFARIIHPQKKRMQQQKESFMHPMSHELAFMNLSKVFRDLDNLEDYTSNEYRPDYLTLFLYECKRGNLEFETVSEVKFHFLQVDNWYFEVSYFNRNSTNRGWLISQLSRLEKSQKRTLLQYIYREL